MDIDSPVLQPADRPVFPVLVGRLPHCIQGVGVGYGDKGQGQRVKSQFKQPAAVRRGVVILPLGNGGGQNLNLPRIQAHAPVQFRSVLFPSVGVGQVDFGRTGFVQDIEDAPT